MWNAENIPRNSELFTFEDQILWGMNYVSHTASILRFALFLKSCEYIPVTGYIHARTGADRDQERDRQVAWS